MRIKESARRVNTWADKHPVWAWIILVIAMVIIATTIIILGGGRNTYADEPFKPSGWHYMASEGLEYTCDPVLGVIVRHPQYGDADHPTSGVITLAVTSYAEMTNEQRARMCDGR